MQFVFVPDMWNQHPKWWLFLKNTKVFKSHKSLTGRWVSSGTPISFTNKTDRHDTAKILLKVALNTITQTPRISFLFCYCIEYCLLFWLNTADFVNINQFFIIFNINKYPLQTNVFCHFKNFVFFKEQPPSWMLISHFRNKYELTLTKLC